MEQHFENSFVVAKWLEAHPKIGKVLHPSLASHHNSYKISLKQCYGHSGVFSFYLREDNYENTKKLFSNLKLIKIATSLGGTETTMGLPREMSHRNWTREKCYEVQVTDVLVRLSIGLEDVEDIIRDLEGALDCV